MTCRAIIATAALCRCVFADNFGGRHAADYSFVRVEVRGCDRIGRGWRCLRGGVCCHRSPPSRRRRIRPPRRRRPSVAWLRWAVLLEARRDSVAAITTVERPEHRGGRIGTAVAWRRYRGLQPFGDSGLPGDRRDVLAPAGLPMWASIVSNVGGRELDSTSNRFLQRCYSAACASNIKNEYRLILTPMGAGSHRRRWSHDQPIVCALRTARTVQLASRVDVPNSLIRLQLRRSGLLC